MKKIAYILLFSAVAFGACRKRQCPAYGQHSQPAVQTLKV